MSPLLFASTDQHEVTWATPVFLLIALALVALNGFFVLMEFAVVKVRASRIEELVRKGDPRALRAKPILERLDAYLSATQLGITIASLALGWVGEPAFAALVSWLFGAFSWSTATSRTLSAVAAFGIITFLHILLGEVAPKSMAIREPERMTLLLAGPLRWIYALFYLPMVVLNGASNMLLRMFGLEAGTHEVAHSEQELRVLLSTAQTTGAFSLNRMLILENIFDLGGQTVREAMIPWPQVHYVSRQATRAQIMRTVTETRFSRYPVVDGAGPPREYLLLKDLIVQSSDADDWTQVLRPLPSVRLDESLEIVMQKLQNDGANMAVVLEHQKVVGIITLEDILEEVVGRIEDEYPRLPRLYLKDALSLGGVVLDLQATNPEDAIRELAAAIPRENLPPDASVAELALARERQLSTDVGEGVSIPHARCPNLAKAILVVGRSEEGIQYDSPSAQRVRLVFLLVTPAERPQIQVFFLSQLANVAASELVRERISRADDVDEVIEIIAAADPAVTG